MNPLHFSLIRKLDVQLAYPIWLKYIFKKQPGLNLISNDTEALSVQRALHMTQQI